MKPRNWRAITHLLAFILLFISLLSGVSAQSLFGDSRSPSAQNFERALTKRYENQDACTEIPLLEGEALKQYAKRIDPHIEQLLSTGPVLFLRRGGREPPAAYAVHEDLMRAFMHFGDPGGKSTSLYPERVISGLKSGASQFIRRSRNGSPLICYGRLKIGQIVRWSEPGDLLGRRVTEVQYKLKVVDAPSWAKKIIKVREDEMLKTMLILMSDGWSVESD